MALIENIQREDLNPIEEAMALQRLQQEFELTQQEVAEAVGKSRSTVTNLLRLMTLQEDVRRLLEHGDLEMGHARALLGLEDAVQSQAARTVVARGLSVRQTEALVRSHQEGAQQPREKPPWTPISGSCRTTCPRAWAPGCRSVTTCAARANWCCPITVSTSWTVSSPISSDRFRAWPPVAAIPALPGDRAGAAGNRVEWGCALNRALNPPIMRAPESRKKPVWHMAVGAGRGADERR